MGLYFRKSSSVGPFRLNFSKSGIGISTGVKGARVSMGPRGTYLNVGRNGVYYRKKIGSSSSKKSGGSRNNNRMMTPQSTCTYQTADTTTDAIRIPTSSGQMTESGLEIIKNIKRAKTLTWLWWIALFVLFHFINGWSILIMGIVRLVFYNFFTATIDYDIDDEAKEKWNSVIENLNGLKTSKKLWVIETSRVNSNTKINTGASRSLQRGVAKVKIVKPNHNTGMKVKAGERSFLISSNKCKILFLPSEVLIKKGSKIVAYAYGDISILCSTTNFIEDGIVSRDAEIIRHTWQYVNKNGTADKRFKNNRQLPVCRYGLLHLKAGNELNVEIHLSNNRIIDGIGSVSRTYSSFLNSGNTYTRPTSNYQQATVNSSVSHRNMTHGYNSYGQNDSWEKNEMVRELNHIGKEFAENGLRNSFETNMDCKVTLIDSQYYQRHFLALYKASKSVLGRMAIIEKCFNEQIEEVDFKFEMISDVDFLLHFYMTSDTCQEAINNFENTGIYVQLNATFRKAVADAEQWAKHNTIPEPVFGEGLPDELFENDVVQAKKANGSLMDEFSDFMNLEDEE